MSRFFTAHQIAAAAAIAAAISLPAAIAGSGDPVNAEPATATFTPGAGKADRLPVRAMSGCAWPYTSSSCEGSVAEGLRTIVVDHNVADRTTVVARMPVGH